MPHILGVGTALPAHVHDQDELKALARRLMPFDATTERHLEIFDNAGVMRRYTVRPARLFAEYPGFRERNRIYLQECVRLGGDALAAACGEAGVSPEAIDDVIFVSTTGVSTPSPESFIAQRLGLRQDVGRTPLFGVGCAGGAVALSRAARMARAQPEGLTAVIAAETCSLTMNPADTSPRSLVGAALFGDGAAAALVAGDARPAVRGPRIVASRSHLFPDTPEYMGWDVSERGLELVLSPRVPALIAAELGGLARGFLGEHGLKLGDISRFVFHPGGPRVLDAFASALGVEPECFEATRRFLEGHGNLSSASLLFVLRSVMARGPRPGEHGLAAAFGPGFAAELLLLRW